MKKPITLAALCFGIAACEPVPVEAPPPPDHEPARTTSMSEPVNLGHGVRFFCHNGRGVYLSDVYNGDSIAVVPVAPECRGES